MRWTCGLLETGGELSFLIFSSHSFLLVFGKAGVSEHSCSFASIPCTHLACGKCVGPAVFLLPSIPMELQSGEQVEDDA